MNHVFLDVHMGISHGRMQEALDEAKIELKRGDTAIFLNRAWTGVKIMTARRAYIYIREERAFTVDMLVGSPKLVGGRPLVLTKEQRQKLEDHWTKVVEKRLARRVVPRKVA